MPKERPSHLYSVLCEAVKARFTPAAAAGDPPTDKMYCLRNEIVSNFAEQLYAGGEEGFYLFCGPLGERIGDHCSPKGVTSALPARWDGLGCLVEREV
ncbi:hypothetical protein EVAR_57261_1 [Eumeta japonica]|uniref:Uncharacterized protein n=1 Tax=Eumeta variegata TaxID=151549 RepID=A0A4C1ZQJ1_EUMVA|nr:hypothetical protein EVAR_57261_1 [Eumeta japonica]